MFQFSVARCQKKVGALYLRVKKGMQRLVVQWNCTAVLCLLITFLEISWYVDRRRVVYCYGYNSLYHQFPNQTNTNSKLWTLIHFVWVFRLYRCCQAFTLGFDWYYRMIILIFDEYCYGFFGHRLGCVCWTFWILPTRILGFMEMV